MKIDALTDWVRRGARFAAVVAAGLVAQAGEVSAQSRYACSALGSGSFPVVESEAGRFFNLELDLISDTRMSWPVIEDISRVAEAFESRGSQLVVVPVPTKGLVYSDTFDAQAAKYAFDPAVAERLYRETLARFAAADVAVVDALSALRDESNGPTMFATDPRLTNDGIRVLAQAVRDVIGPSTAPNRFSAMATGTAIVSSITHQQIQSRCTVFLPLPETTAYDTISLTSGGVSDRVILATDGVMTGEGLVPEGLFAAALGAEVTQIVAPGYPLSALAAVAGSDAFQEHPPKAVIWVVPVSADLAAFGTRPLREVSALVRQSCKALPADAVTMTQAAVTVDLQATLLTEDTGLKVHMSDRATDELALTFVMADGGTTRRTILRHGVGAGTSSFLMPFDSVWMNDVQSVTVETPDGWQALPEIAVCGV